MGCSSSEQINNNVYTISYCSLIPVKGKKNIYKINLFAQEEAEKFSERKFFAQVGHKDEKVLSFVNNKNFNKKTIFYLYFKNKQAIKNLYQMINLIPYNYEDLHRVVLLNTEEVKGFYNFFIQKKTKNLEYSKFIGSIIDLNDNKENLETMNNINLTKDDINKEENEENEEDDDSIYIECIDSLYLIRPPNIWMFDANGSEISWLSPNASSWYEGLKIRAEKLREWLSCPNDTRPPFYFPGFLKPQGFLAAFRQEFFKMKKKSPGNAKEFEKLALDQIDLSYLPDRNETDPKNMQRIQKPKDKMDSIIIYGLYIEGAVWGGGSKEGYLVDDPDPNSRNTIIKFPVITVKGVIVSDNKASLLGPTNASYSCPLYKYPKRTDKYIITDIKLKINGSDQDDKFWQKRGVALLCNKE